MYRFFQKLANFMYGRYGLDNFGRFLIVIYIMLAIANIFVIGHIADIVLYGEGLHSTEWDIALQWTRNADLFIVVGSSLQVAPANMLPHYFGRDDKLVIINRDPTPLDFNAELVFHDDIQEVFKNIRIPFAVQKAIDDEVIKDEKAYHTIIESIYGS